MNSHLTAEALLLKDQLACSTPDIFSELIINYYIKHGYTNYDESVTQIDHSLQTANLASLDNAGNEMIVTALLHDMGHILIDEFNGKKDFLNEDRLHEFVGANFLSDYFPEVRHPFQYPQLRALFGLYFLLILLFFGYLEFY